MMGGEITIEDERIEANEPVANINVRSSNLKGVEISGEIRRLLALQDDKNLKI